MNRNEYYHEFTPKIDPALVIVLLAGLLAVITLSYLIVRIRPINQRCRRYHSVGSKVSKVTGKRHRCGAARADEKGFALIMPSTSFDWVVAAAYSVFAMFVTGHYHGAGLLQWIWNHGMGEFTYIVVMIIGVFVIMPLVVKIERFVQFVSARKIYLATWRETGEKIRIFEEWGIYDKMCRTQFNKICEPLSRKEKRAVRIAVSDPNISEKAKLDRAESFVLAQDRLKRKTRPKEFESILDSFLEFVQEK